MRNQVSVCFGPPSIVTAELLVYSTNKLCDSSSLEYLTLVEKVADACFW